MGKFLRLASTETTTLKIGEDDELVVKTDISKGDFNQLLRYLPDDVGTDASFTPVEADEFTTGLFKMLVTGWSLDVPATVENYLSMPRDVTAAIDALLLEHFNSITVTEQEKKSSPKSR